MHSAIPCDWNYSMWPWELWVSTFLYHVEKGAENVSLQRWKNDFNVLIEAVTEQGIPWLLPFLLLHILVFWTEVKLLFLLFENQSQRRERERASEPSVNWLIPPSAHNKQAWARPNPGTQKSICISNVGSRGLSTWVLTRSLPGCTLVGSWMGSRARTQTRCCEREYWAY